MPEAPRRIFFGHGNMQKNDARCPNREEGDDAFPAGSGFGIAKLGFAVKFELAVYFACFPFLLPTWACPVLRISSSHTRTRSLLLYFIRSRVRNTATN